MGPVEGESVMVGAVTVKVALAVSPEESFTSTVCGPSFEAIIGIVM